MAQSDYWTDYSDRKRRRREWAQANAPTTQDQVKVENIQPHYSHNRQADHSRKRHKAIYRKHESVLLLADLLETIASDRYELGPLSNYEFGPYCLDIFLPAAMLAVELGTMKDKERLWLEGKFVRAIEVNQHEMRQPYTVAQRIMGIARERTNRYSGSIENVPRSSLRPSAQAEPAQNGTGVHSQPWQLPIAQAGTLDRGGAN